MRVPGLLTLGPADIGLLTGKRVGRLRALVVGRVVHLQDRPLRLHHLLLLLNVHGLLNQGLLRLRQLIDVAPIALQHHGIGQVRVGGIDLGEHAGAHELFARQGPAVRSRRLGQSRRREGVDIGHRLGSGRARRRRVAGVLVGILAEHVPPIRTRNLRGRRGILGRSCPRRHRRRHLRRQVAGRPAAGRHDRTAAGRKRRGLPVPARNRLRYGRFLNRCRLLGRGSDIVDRRIRLRHRHRRHHGRLGQHLFARIPRLGMVERIVGSVTLGDRQPVRTRGRGRLGPWRLGHAL